METVEVFVNSFTALFAFIPQNNLIAEHLRVKFVLIFVVSAAIRETRATAERLSDGAFGYFPK